MWGQGHKQKSDNTPWITATDKSFILKPAVKSKRVFQRKKIIRIYEDNVPANIGENNPNKLQIAQHVQIGIQSL